MHARFVTIAAAAFTLAPGAAAQPSSSTATQNNSAQSHPAPVVLASADHVGAPAPATDAPVPARPHRAARVTTCRCGGDPQPGAQEEQQ
jgi:hypothetical protein